MIRSIYFNKELEVKLNIFLIHGAFQGGYVWRPLSSRLETTGHTVFAPSLSGNSLTAHIDQITDLISMNAREEQIVLLGHSYGSLVVTEIAKRLQKQVRGLIYLDAPIPFHPTGEPQSLLDILGAGPTEFFMQQTVNGMVEPFPPAAFGLDDVIHKDVITMHQSQALDCFIEKGASWSLEESPSFPITYIQCAPNEFTNQQVEKAKALDWDLRTLPESGHCPMITHPGPLFQLLNADIFPKITADDTAKALDESDMSCKI